MRKQLRRSSQDTFAYTTTQSCRDLEFAQGHSLEQEDPFIYTREDREGVALERQWPDIPLPTADQEEGAAPSVNPSLLKKALDIHHMYVEYLKRFGVDPCKEYNA